MEQGTGKEREACFDQAAALLPGELGVAALRLPERTRERAEELRLRVGQPMEVLLPEGEQPVPGGPAEVTAGMLEQVLEVATQASVHTALEQVRAGYFTVRGGHRIGLCGTAVLREGKIHTLRQLSSLSIRIAHSVPGVGRTLLPALRTACGIRDTLILSPPGGGKTTLLRDLICGLSDGVAGPALRVGVADERGEVAALWEGRPQLAVGRHTDVLESCPKAEGLMSLLRGMNPQVLAADEITSPRDIDALTQASHCGVGLLATAHAAGAEDLGRRPLYRALLEAGIFRQVIEITRKDGIRRCRVRALEGCPW